MLVLLAGAALAASAAAAVPVQPGGADDAMKAAYVRAAKVLDANLAGAIVNAQVTPHWLQGGRFFWYQREGDHGPSWQVVESATGRRSAAFDPARLRAAVAATGTAGSGSPLHVQAIDGDPSALTVWLEARGRTVACRIPVYACQAEDPPEGGPIRWSPDRTRGAFVQSYDLWLTRRGGPPVRLTHDGVENDAYGALPGGSTHYIRDAEAATPGPPANVSWTPDGKWLIGVRSDDREVLPYPYVEWNPKDGGWRPRLFQPRIALLGDAHQGETQAYAIDVETGHKLVFHLPDGLQFDTPDGMHFNAAAYAMSPDGRYVYGLARRTDDTLLALLELDLHTGAVRTVIQERAATYANFNALAISQPNVRVLAKSGEVVWFSQRDGWPRLYLYSLRNGGMLRSLTATAMPVRDVVSVDQAHRQLYFTSDGAEGSPDPYQARLYSVSLDGGTPRLLTPEAAVHSVVLGPPGDEVSRFRADAGVSPDGAWVVDTYSTVDKPPVSVLRSAMDGRVVSVLERADVSRVIQAGWRPPERVRVVSADGRTPLWGTVYFPPSMHPGQRYPVIAAEYGGPFMFNAPADYPSAVAFINPVSRASLAELGFIVVTIDGRGTPGRSKTFNDASYGAAFADPELADWVAGIRQLAERYKTFDLDRVGIFGHSFGGYTSARAMLTYPDFFKVGVSSAGPYDFQGAYSTEHWFGDADYGNGLHVRPEPSAVPAPYRQLDLRPIASRLKGRLLLVYGDLDENAPPGMAMQFVKALTDADRPYDLIYLPGWNHGFFRGSAYYTRRMWDYFVEHLMHVSPPDDFHLVITGSLPDPDT